MDFVYICRPGENEELRYSIRSLITNYPDANIFIVGGKPDWYSGDYIFVEDKSNKFENINNCYRAILQSNKISNDFILMNDDFFLLSNIKSFNYYSGNLKDKIISHVKLNGNSSYARALKGAVKELAKLGIEEPKNYDIHTPMAFKKAQLAQVIDLSLAPRSMYGNVFDIGGLDIQDVKVYKDTLNFDLSKEFISTEDNSFKLISHKLATLFPDKSPFE